MLNLTLSQLWWTDKMYMNMRQEESKTLMMLTLNYCTNPRCFLRSSRQSFFALILSTASASGLLVTRGNCQLSLLSEFSLKCAPKLRVFITPETRWRSLLFLLLVPHLWLLVFFQARQDVSAKLVKGFLNLSLSFHSKANTELLGIRSTFLIIVWHSSATPYFCVVPALPRAEAGLLIT